MIQRTTTIYCLLVATATTGFMVPQQPTSTATTRLYNGESNLERIEYKIYPDGRVEQKVMGVKGGDCLKLTEEINQALGVVISTEPTEEMYEQKVEIDQTVTNANVENGGGDSWEGASSW